LRITMECNLIENGGEEEEEIETLISGDKIAKL
jgi:hypothetical protein